MFDPWKNSWNLNESEKGRVLLKTGASNMFKMVLNFKSACQLNIKI